MMSRHDGYDLRSVCLEFLKIGMSVCTMLTLFKPSLALAGFIGLGIGLALAS